MEKQEYAAKSVVIGRKPRKQEDMFKTAFIKIYDKTNPLDAEDFPLKELDFPDIRKVVLHTSPVDYFLEGNDLVYDNITKVTIEIESKTIHVKVE